MQNNINGLSNEESRFDSMKTLSVIIPITERHDNIIELYYDLKEAFSEKIIVSEVIFVVDGNFHEAYQDLKSLKDKGEKITIIKHARAFGEATCLSEGFKHSSTGLIMTYPSYYQIEASEVYRMFDLINGFDMVTVRRWPRNDSKLNQIQTTLFHHLVKSITGVKMSDTGCSVRLMKRAVLEEIELYGDLHRFLPILADKQGFKVTEIEIRQSYREKRMRTYPLGVYVRRLIDLLTVFFLVKFSKKPLRFFGLAGTVILTPGVILTLYLVIGRIWGSFALSERPMFLLGILLIVLGIQLFAIGLVGEIIIFTHAKEIKEYKVEEVIN